MARTIATHRLAQLLGDAPRRPPAYRSLAAAMRLLVDDGRVPAGTRLPSERSLADALGVSRATVTRAYAVLGEGGYARSRRGSGTMTDLPDATSRDGRGALLPTSDEADHGRGTLIDLTCAVLPPPAQMMAAYERALTRWPTYLQGSGYYPLGVPALREAIAARYTERGLPTSTDEVMITSGAIGAHALTARAHLQPGTRVLVDSPVYPNGTESLRADGARLVAMPLDDGWDLDAWSAAMRDAAGRVGPGAALLLPDHQNPTGLLMADDERAHLGRALTRHRMLAVVDETLAETSIDPPATGMPAPFAAHHRRTVTIGGASKSHWSGLRIGWVRAPAELMGALVAARTTLDLGSPVLEQLALLELLADDAEISAHRAALARSRRDVLATALHEHLPEWRFTLPAGGFCLWLTLPAPVSTAFVLSAETHGVLLAPGPRFAPEPGLERHLRLPFTLPEPVLHEAVRRMALAWGSLEASPGSTRQPATPLIA